MLNTRCLASAILVVLARPPTRSQAFSNPSSVVTRAAPITMPSSSQCHPHDSLVSSPLSQLKVISQRQPTATTRWQTASEQEVPAPKSNIMSQLRQQATRFCNCFPIWILLTALAALKNPAPFLKVPSSTFPTQIGMLMLCMGISLRPADFQRVVQRPGAVLIAFLGCYGVMPVLAFGIGKALTLPPSLAAGLVLVACINGAQASNLCTYIGQGDLALSVMMTTMTTIGAIVMTPLMGKLLLGQVVPVNASAITLSVLQVVLAPIILGMSFNAGFPKLVNTILPFSPILGVILTCMMVGTSVAGCAEPILNAGFKLQASAALLHGLGGVAGYFVTKPFYGEDVCRTFAIQFAMKSSAFGYLLASLHFADFAIRVPSAVSIVWMALIGSSLGVASRFFPPAECVVEAE